MARPRTASDDEIVERISAYLAQRDWPASSWSLAEVSPAAGLSPAGLVKRFGSRAGLLRALGESWLAAIPAAAETGQPLHELRAFAHAHFAVPSAAAARGGLADLVADFADAGAGAVLRDGTAKQLRYVTALLGELHLSRVTDPLRAAAALLDALHGGLIRRASAGGEGDSATLETPDDTINYFLELWT